MTAVLAAAGSGERLGAGGPKAFVELAGRPMIEWSLDAFRAAGVGSIVVAVPPREVSSSHLPDALQVGPGDGSTTVVPGGATRAESVSNALQAVKTDLVAIHDAARPLLTAELVASVVAALEADPEAAGAIAAAPVTDTIKRAGSRVLSSHHDGGVDSALGVEETLDRSELWAAQTPQAFRVAALRDALEAWDRAARGTPTDEAMPVEAAGGRVLIVPSASENLKVTSPTDLALAERLLAARP